MSTHLTKNILEDSEIRFYKVEGSNPDDEVTWFASLMPPAVFDEAVKKLRADMKTQSELDIPDLEDYCDCFLFSNSWTFYV